MWRQHALGDPAKGIWVRPRDQGPLPLSHFFHMADHISLGQKPEKCVQAVLGRRAHTRGCPFHPQILHTVFPAWFPKTSSSGLASGNSSWSYNGLCLGFIKAAGEWHRSKDSSLSDLGKWFLQLFALMEHQLMYAKRGIVLQFRQLLKDSFIIQLHLKDRSIIVINVSF